MRNNLVSLKASDVCPVVSQQELSAAALNQIQVVLWSWQPKTNSSFACSNKGGLDSKNKLFASAFQMLPLSLCQVHEHDKFNIFEVDSQDCHKSTALQLIRQVWSRLPFGVWYLTPRRDLCVVEVTKSA